MYRNQNVVCLFGLLVGLAAVCCLLPPELLKINRYKKSSSLSSLIRLLYNVDKPVQFSLVSEHKEMAGLKVSVSTDQAILLDGSKAFWQSRTRFRIIIVEHISFNCLEIIAINTAESYECSRLYVNKQILLMKLDEESIQYIYAEKLAETLEHSEARNNELLNEIRNRFLVRFLYARLNIRWDEADHSKVFTFLQPTGEDIVMDSETEIQKMDIERTKPEDLVPFVRQEGKTSIRASSSFLSPVTSPTNAQLGKSAHVAHVAAKIQQVVILAAKAFFSALHRKFRFDKRCKRTHNPVKVKWMVVIHAVIKRNNLAMVKRRLRLLETNKEISHKRSSRFFGPGPLLSPLVLSSNDSLESKDEGIAMLPVQGHLKDSADDNGHHEMPSIDLAVSALTEQLHRTLGKFALKPLDTSTSTTTGLLSGCCSPQALDSDQISLQARQHEAIIKSHLTMLDVSNIFGASSRRPSIFSATESSKLNSMSTSAVTSPTASFMRNGSLLSPTNSVVKIGQSNHVHSSASDQKKSTSSRRLAPLSPMVKQKSISCGNSPLTSPQQTPRSTSRIRLRMASNLGVTEGSTSSPSSIRNFGNLNSSNISIAKSASSSLLHNSEQYQQNQPHAQQQGSTQFTPNLSSSSNDSIGFERREKKKSTHYFLPPISK